MPSAAEIPKKKKPNYFDNYSGFADSPALSVPGGGEVQMAGLIGRNYFTARIAFHLFVSLERIR
jgi:hypothetical protein